MCLTSTNNPTFRAKTAQWIAERHEVLAIIQYSHCGGSKDFEFFESREAFDARLAELPPRTCVTVFGERQFPIRGLVNDDLIARSLALIPDGVEFAVVGLELVRYGACAWYSHTIGISATELSDELQERRGELVAIGRFPPWLEDSSEVVSATVPNSDGSVTPGVY
jgi:hypothetical protein